MIRTLVWKEYREHRGAWLVIALLGCLALLGISFISAPVCSQNRMGVLNE